MADGSVPVTKEDDGYSVARLRRQYMDFLGAKRDEIEEQREARHYYHGNQWTRAEINKLKKRHQPVITSNRVGRKIDAVVGLLERLKQDPKAYPRTPKQEEGADLATATLRYVLDRANWKSISPEGGRTAGVNGIGGVELFLTQGDAGDPELDMDIVDADTYFYDPRSVRHDFSDALYMGVAKWIDHDLAKEMFPDAEADIDLMMDGGGSIESWQQQDREKRWIDIDEKRLFLVEHWYKRGSNWHWCFYCGTTKLDGGDSPFIDELGKSFCRFLMFSAYVDHDGDRYGFVRNMKSAQDEINARRSKAMHLLNTRRIVMEAGAVQDIEKVRIEASRPDGVVEYNPGLKFEFDDASKMNDMEGQIAFLEEAKNEIENFGFNPALVGSGVQDMSGRAIKLQQEAGIAELGPFFLAWRDWKVRVYRACWNIVQRLWTGERWIRVTDDEGVAQFIQLNGVQLDDTDKPQMVNALGSLDVDIILDEGADNMNMMQDTFDALAAMGQSVPWQVLVEMNPGLQSALKKRIIETYGQPPQDPMAQVKGALEMENAQATIGATKAKGMKDFSSAIKTFAEVGTMPEELAGQREVAMVKAQQRPQGANAP